MKFAIIKALADDHLYTAFAGALATALQDLGHGAAVVDTGRHADVHGIVTEIHQLSPDAVISFSSFLGGLGLDDGRSVYDLIGTRFIGWHLDHPIYALANIANPVAGRVSLYPNESHVRFAERLGVTGRAGVMIAGGEALPRGPSLYAERSIPILVAATWNGVPQRPLDSSGDPLVRRFVEHGLERLLADRQASLIDAFDAACADLGLDLALDQGVLNILKAVLTYVRHHDRLAAVEGLVRSGLPLTLVGAGWRAHFGERKAVRYLDAVPFRDMQALYDDARVVVNFNAANGGRERAIHAMLAGAAVVSDDSTSFARCGVDPAGLAHFDRSAPNALAEVSAALLEGDRGRVQAEAGYLNALATQCWAHRAQAMVEAVFGAAA